MLAGYDLELPPWICKPRVRMPPEEHIKKMEAAVAIQTGAVFHQETETINEKEVRQCVIVYDAFWHHLIITLYNSYLLFCHS